MDIKTLQQALKLQNDLASRLTQTLAMPRTGKLPAIDVLLKEKEQQLAAAQAEVEIAVKERDMAVSRWDERVAQRKAGVASLQKEIANYKNQLAKQKDVASKALKEGATEKTKKTTRAKKTG